MAEAIELVCPHCQAVNRVPAARLEEKPACGRCHGSLFDGHPVDLDEAGFDRHLKRDGVPVVLDIWAPWCGPCKAMAPAFEQAARELEPRVRFAKLNADNAPNVSARYGIRGIPTVIVFNNGREIARQSGAMSAPQLGQWLRQHI
ncbi:MAG: thioredoxin TrxC [Gammaproteobacteria bacterium]|jgi:thioredoxin 2